MKAVVAAFNQEKALVGAFSAIVKTCVVQLTEREPVLGPLDAAGEVPDHAVDDGAAALGHEAVLRRRAEELLLALARRAADC